MNPVEPIEHSSIRKTCKNKNNIFRDFLGFSNRSESNEFGDTTFIKIWRVVMKIAPYNVHQWNKNSDLEKSEEYFSELRKWGYLHNHSSDFYKCGIPELVRFRSVRKTQKIPKNVVFIFTCFSDRTVFYGFYGVHMRASESKLIHGEECWKKWIFDNFFPVSQKPRVSSGWYLCGLESTNVAEL